MNDRPITLVKALCMGESGNGKTGALASLAIAGYNLHIIDYDNKMNSANTLRSVLEDDYPEAWARVRWKSVIDKKKFLNGKITLVRPCTAYRAFGSIVTEWDIEKFTPNDVLVIDTLSSMSDAAFNEACAMAGKMGLQADGSDHPRPQEYGWMADSLKLAMECVTDDAVGCHLIVNAHIKIDAPEDEQITMKTDKMGHAADAFTRAIGLPNARGKEIPRIVARYFNNAFYYTRLGPKRVITTQPTAMVDVKTSRLKGVERYYELSDGLAKLFRHLGASGPNLMANQGQKEKETVNAA